MSGSIYVGGSSKGVGKTFVALGLLHLLNKHYRTGAWKPIEVGQIHYNATEAPSDGEALYQASQMTEHPNLVNPFMLNEDLPPVLAARRDGIRLQTAVLNQYFKMLCSRFERLVIEGGRSLYTPLTETQTELDFLSQWNPQVLWVTNIGERELAETLLQVKALQAAHIEVVGILLSNRENQKHADLIHYQWLTLEEQLSIQVLALLPFLPTGMADVPAIGNLLQTHFNQNYLHLLGKPSHPFQNSETVEENP